MMSRFPLLLKNSFIYALSILLSRSINFILLPFYTNIFTPNEFGIISILFSVMIFLNVVWGLGLNSAFFKYFVMEANIESKKTIFSTIVNTLFFVSVIFSIIIVVFSKQISNLLFDNEVYAIYLIYICLIIILDQFYYFSFLILRAEHKALLFGLFNFNNLVICVCANLILIGIFHFGIMGVVLSNLLSSGITFMISIILMRKWYQFRFSIAMCKKLLSFGLPFLPLSLSLISIEVLDRFILTYYLDLDNVGIYSAGYRLGAVMSVLVTAFNYAWAPFYVSIAHQENCKQVYSLVLTYFVLIGIFVVLNMLVFIKDILSITFMSYSLLPEEFLRGVAVFPYVVSAYFFYGLYFIFVVGLVLQEKTKYLILIGLAAVLINFLGNIVLIPLFKNSEYSRGILGAAISTLIAYVALSFLVFYYAQKYYNIKYEYNRISKIVLIFIFLIIPYFIFQNYFNIFHKLLVVFVFLSLLFLTKFFKSSELLYFKQKLSTIFVH